MNGLVIVKLALGELGELLKRERESQRNKERN